MEKNICMYCGRKSKNRFEYRVLDKKDIFRDFCCLECLMNYYWYGYSYSKMKKELSPIFTKHGQKQRDKLRDKMLKKEENKK